MATIFENSGTISLTSGSRTVTGSGTSWLVDYDGIALNVGGLSFPVSTIDSLSSLTLVEPYNGETASGIRYTFTPLPPTIPKWGTDDYFKRLQRKLRG